MVLDRQFNTSTSLSLEGIAKGSYYLTLKAKNRIVTKKIIID